MNLKLKTIYQLINYRSPPKTVIWSASKDRVHKNSLRDSKPHKHTNKRISYNINITEIKGGFNT